MTTPDSLFLMNCVRYAIGLDAAGDQVRETANAVTDWRRVLESAHQQRLMPQIAFAAALLPAQVRPEAAEWERQWTRTSLALTAELLRVATVLDDRGIAALPLKGPALGQYLYGDPARRSFSDLDLFVGAGDAGPAMAALQQLGYRSRWPDAVAARQRRFDWYRETPLRHSDRGIDLDLHWAMTPRYYPGRIDEDRLWQRTGRIAFCGGSVRAPHPQDYLEYLCLHGERHQWAALGWVADVAALVTAHRNRIDPALSSAAWDGWDLAHRTFGVPAPPGARPKPPSWRRRVAYRAAVVLIPTEADWAGALDLPRQAEFLYYPLRLMRIAGRVLRGSS